MKYAAKPLARAIVIACVVALAAGTAAVRPAEAAGTPCWKTLLNDWYDGRIDKTYPVKCYEDALGHLPTDVQIYSSAREDIQRALASAIQRKKDGGKGGGAIPGGTTTTTGPDGKTRTVTVTTETPPTTTEPGRKTSNGPFGQAIDKLNPGSADSLPLPLLILGGLAILLVGAGVAGMLVRRNQSG